MFMGYSTQHAGDVYRFLHMKINHIIYSRDEEWLGKMWHEFYCSPSSHSADTYVDPFDDYMLLSLCSLSGFMMLLSGIPYVCKNCVYPPLVIMHGVSVISCGVLVIICGVGVMVFLFIQ